MSSSKEKREMKKNKKKLVKLMREAHGKLKRGDLSQITGILSALILLHEIRLNKH
jgi:hypothetical protein